MQSVSQSHTISLCLGGERGAKERERAEKESGSLTGQYQSRSIESVRQRKEENEEEEAGH